MCVYVQLSYCLMSRHTQSFMLVGLFFFLEVATPPEPTCIPYTIIAFRFQQLQACHHRLPMHAHLWDIPMPMVNESMQNRLASAELAEDPTFSEDSMSSRVQLTSYEGFDSHF